MQNQDYRNIHGSNPSDVDTRTPVEKASLFDTFATVFGVSPVGSKIKPQCILDQNRVGICTAIGNVEIVFDRTGKRFSEDFQYLLQKKYFDLNWNEGSAVINSLKASLKYGYLPKEIMDRYFVRDANDTYNQYIVKLEQIANNVSLMEVLLSQCDKTVLKGYTSVKTDFASLYNAIGDAQNGVLVRFSCGSSWFYRLVNGIRQNWWDGEVIEPITEPVGTPTFPLTGHCVSLPYAEDKIFCGNSWNTTWCADGHAKMDYFPTEAYKMYFTAKPDSILPSKSTFKYTFTNTFGMSFFYSKDCEALQTILAYEGCMQAVDPKQRGYYGLKTSAGVKLFQAKYGIDQIGSVGPKTLAQLNLLYS